ncbi:MAG: peptidoglycan DD-metalloendopeptidase family protein [Bacillota bacterium]
MGNYYKRRGRPFGARRRSGKAAFAAGAVLVAVFALAQFGSVGDGVREAVAESGGSFVTAAKTAWNWGHDSLTGGETSFSVPVSSGVVVENFGVVSAADGSDAYHNGIDIKVPAGSEVLAAADGSVADVSERDDGTFWITVEHSKHWSTVYGRLGEAKVAVGDKVAKGDVLGTPAGEILHFEVREDDTEKDPVRYFNGGGEP